MTYTATTVDLPDNPAAEDTIRNAQPAATGYIGLAVLVACFAMARSGVAFTGADGFLQACAVMFLVMAAYGHSKMRNLIIGSTTTEMVRLCKIPVVLYR